MKIVILQTAEFDLRWYRRYYETIFKEGRAQARLRYVAATRVLRENPYAGLPMEDLESRKFSITGTPFHFIYRVGDKQIEVLQVKDGRSGSAGAPENIYETEQ
jgi:plasmid stabilization system protein ParE